MVPKRGAGCERCNGTGYKGRVGLYEVMEVTEELRELILVGASGLELKRKAVEAGMITLRRSGLRKVMAGVTTIEEVVRETVQVRRSDRTGRGQRRMATLPELLRTVVELHGSDLHLTTQTPPQIRVHGKLQTLDLPVLGPSETKALAYSVLTDAQKKRFEESWSSTSRSASAAWRGSAATSSTSAARSRRSTG